jgi:hypothetical protein
VQSAADSAIERAVRAGDLARARLAA